MKACRKFQKRIALLTTEKTDDPSVVAHLRECDACRSYAREIAALFAAHEARATSLPEVDVSPRLRQRVAAAINQTSTASWIYISLRKAVAGAAVAALALLILTFWNKRPAPAPVEPVSSTAANKEIKPSYAAYRNAFSADELEMALYRCSSGAAGDEIYRVRTALVNSP